MRIGYSIWGRHATIDEVTWYNSRRWQIFCGGNDYHTHYNDHLVSYMLNSDHAMRVLKHSDLFSVWPLSLYRSNNDTCFVNRYSHTWIPINFMTGHSIHVLAHWTMDGMWHTKRFISLLTLAICQNWTSVVLILMKGTSVRFWFSSVVAYFTWLVLPLGPTGRCLFHL